MSAFIAVDIGGTKLAAGIVSAEGALIRRVATPTPETNDPEVLWRTLASLLDQLDADDDHNASAVGVGCGGPMALGGETVSPLNIPAWRAFPLRARIAAHLGLPTFVDNDAKALARGEGWVGAARGVPNYLAMVVSTGVGGGIVIDGRMLDGATGNAGHIGHIIVAPNGRPCVCGTRGCLEAEASGTAIAAITGAHPSLASADVIERTGLLVGRAVGMCANLLNLNLAVVAGSVALGFGEPFFAAAQHELDRVCTIEFSLGTRIIRAGLGDEGPLIGAASVARALTREPMS